MEIHIILLLLGVASSIAFPCLMFLTRCRIYDAWARVVSVLVCIFGLGWAVVGFVLIHAETITPGFGVYALMGAKPTLGGVCIGLVLSILIAKPYKNKTLEK